MAACRRHSGPPSGRRPQFVTMLLGAREGRANSPSNFEESLHASPSVQSPCGARCGRDGRRLARRLRRQQHPDLRAERQGQVVGGARASTSGAPTSCRTWSRPSKASPRRSSNVLTSVVEARAKATQAQVQIPPDILNNPEAMKRFQDAQNSFGGALRQLLVGGRALSRHQVGPELPGAAVAARGHREPHRHRAPRLHRGGARLQYRADHVPRAGCGSRCSTPRRSRWRRSTSPRPRRRRRASISAPRSRPRPAQLGSMPVTPMGRPAHGAGRQGEHARLAGDLPRPGGRRLALAEPQFPALTGRIVDEADLLTAEDRARAGAGAQGARGQIHRSARDLHDALAAGLRDRGLRLPPRAHLGHRARRTRTTASS